MLIFDPVFPWKGGRGWVKVGKVGGGGMEISVIVSTIKIKLKATKHHLFF